MKRWVLCRVIGDPLDVDNPTRGQAGDAAGANSSFVIPTNQQGLPLYVNTFGQVGTLNISAVAAVPNCYVFPDFALDAKMSGMGAQVKADMIQSVQAYRLTNSPVVTIDMSFVTDDLTWREVLQAIVNQFDPSKPLNGFDVADGS